MAMLLMPHIEYFDTSSGVAGDDYQLLASLCELYKSLIQERVEHLTFGPFWVFTSEVMVMLCDSVDVDNFMDFYSFHLRNKSCSVALTLRTD